MSQNIDQSSGFTLLEVLVSLAILSAVSIITVQSLYSVLIVRSKQQGIQTTATEARQALNEIVNAIQTASNAAVSLNTLTVRGDPCRWYRLNATTHAIEQSIDGSGACVAGAFTAITSPASSVSALLFSKNPDGSINATISGVFTDQFGSHNFDYQTSALPRVSL